MKTNTNRRYFSLLSGHPDKVCSLINAALTDAYIRQEPTLRLNTQVSIQDNAVILGGEVYSDVHIDSDGIVRSVISALPHNDSAFVDVDRLSVLNAIKRIPGLQPYQRWNQKRVMGYAANENELLIPSGQLLVNKIASVIDELASLGVGPNGCVTAIVALGPDGRTCLTSIDVNISHCISDEQLRGIITEIVQRALSDPEIYHSLNIAESNISLQINQSRGGAVMRLPSFGISSKMTGITPSSALQSGSFTCRHLAKNIVHSGVCKSCTVSAAYDNEQPIPTDVRIEAPNTDSLLHDALMGWINDSGLLNLDDTAQRFKLQRPIYFGLCKNARYGYPSTRKNSKCITYWENTDLSQRVLKACKKKTKRCRV